jgi:hypothetical protein
MKEYYTMKAMTGRSVPNKNPIKPLNTSVYTEHTDKNVILFQNYSIT